MTVCAHVQRLIPLFYDGELDGLARREVSDHVADCAACSRVLGLFDRERELLQQMVDDQIAEIDFSGFWLGVESRLSERQPSLSERYRLWWNSWRPFWSWRTPLWATATIVLLVGAAVIMTSIEREKKIEPRRIADNDQAQIESLSAADTVLVWNEPVSNATVIWVSDDGEGGRP